MIKSLLINHWSSVGSNLICHGHLQLGNNYCLTVIQVQAVLLVLGGCEVPPGLVSTTGPTSYGEKVPSTVESPQLGYANISVLSKSFVSCVQSTTVAAKRVASLLRFREKRKERCFDKKIRYGVRKEVAQKYRLNPCPVPSRCCRRVSQLDGYKRCNHYRRQQDLIVRHTFSPLLWHKTRTLPNSSTSLVSYLAYHLRLLVGLERSLMTSS